METAHLFQCEPVRHRHPRSCSLYDIMRGCLCLLLCFAVCTGSMIRLPLKIASFEAKRERMVSKRTQRDIAGQRNNLRGQTGQGYCIELGIGTPPQQFNVSVLIDTGSSNFAIAAKTNPDLDSYFEPEKSSTYVNYGTQVSVPYTQGQWSGPLGTDVVTVAGLDNVTVQPNIAFIFESKEFFINGSGWAGILGLGYAAIAMPDSSVVPFMDTLVHDAGIDDIFTIQLCPNSTNSDDSEESGTLTFGGVDMTLASGALLYTPIYKEWYYQVVITDMAVGGQSLNMDCKEYNFDKTFIDSGTTNLRLPNSVYEKVVQTIRQQTRIPPGYAPDGFWSGDEELCWEKGMVPFSSFPYLSISLMQSHSMEFRLHISPLQYLRSYEGQFLSNSRREECFKFSIASSETGTVIGAVIMEGYYVVFDRRNKSIGFAQSTCTKQGTAIGLQSTVEGPYTSKLGNNTLCAYVKPEHDRSMLMVVVYVMVAVLALCLLPLAILTIQCQIIKCRQHRAHAATDNSNLIDEDR